MTALQKVLINFTDQYIPNIKDVTTLLRFNNHIMRLLKVYASPESNPSVFQSLDRQLSHFMQLSLQEIEKMTAPLKKYIAEHPENKGHLTTFLHTDNALSELTQTAYDNYWKRIPECLQHLQAQERESLDREPIVIQAGQKVTARTQRRQSVSSYDYILTIGQQEWSLPGGYGAYRDLGWCPPQEMINSVMDKESSTQCFRRDYMGSGGYEDNISVSEEYILKTKINSTEGRLPYSYNDRTGIKSYCVGYLFGVTDVNGNTYDIDAFGMESALHHNYGMFVQTGQSLMHNGKDVTHDFWRRLSSLTWGARSECEEYQSGSSRPSVARQTETPSPPVFDGLVQNQSRRISQDIVNQLGALTHAKSQEVIPQMHENVFIRFDFTDQAMKEKAIKMLPFRYHNGTWYDSISIPLSIGVPFLGSHKKKGQLEAAYESECELGKQGFIIDEELRDYHSVLHFSSREALENAIPLLVKGTRSAYENTPNIVNPFSIKVKGLSLYLTGYVNIAQLDKVLRENAVQMPIQQHRLLTDPASAREIEEEIEHSSSASEFSYTLKDSIERLFPEALWPLLTIEEHSFSVCYPDFAPTAQNELRHEIFCEALELLRRMVMWSDVELNLDFSQGSYMVRIPEEQKKLFLTAINDGKTNGVILGYIFYKLETAHLGFQIQDKLLLTDGSAYEASAAFENETSTSIIVKENRGELTLINTARDLQYTTFEPLFIKKAQQAARDNNLTHLRELMTSWRGPDYQKQLNDLLLTSVNARSLKCARWLIEQGASSPYIDTNSHLPKRMPHKDTIAAKDYASKRQVYYPDSSHYQSPFLWAVRNRDFDMISLILEKHVVSSYEDESGETIRDIDVAFSWFFEDESIPFSEKRPWLLTFLNKGASMDYKGSTRHCWDYEYKEEEDNLYSTMVIPKYSYFFRALREGDRPLLNFLLNECHYKSTPEELTMIFSYNSNKLQNLPWNFDKKYIQNMINAFPLLLDREVSVSLENCVMALKGISASRLTNHSVSHAKERIKQKISTFSDSAMHDYFSQQCAKFLELNNDYYMADCTVKAVSSKSPTTQEDNALNERSRIQMKVLDVIQTVEVALEACSHLIDESVYGVFLEGLQTCLNDPEISMFHKKLLQAMKEKVMTSLPSLRPVRETDSTRNENIRNPFPKALSKQRQNPNERNTKDWSSISAQPRDGEVISPILSGYRPFKDTKISHLSKHTTCPPPIKPATSTAAQEPGAESSCCKCSIM